MKEQWVCTDSDTEQYGRQVGGRDVYEFKQPDINGGEPVEIDLSRYSNQKIEECINSYGYTLKPGGIKLKIAEHYNSVHMLYGEEADWIIAECLFEMEEEPNN